MASTTSASAYPQSARGWGDTLRRGAYRLAELATTPLVPADYLDVFNPLRPGADTSSVGAARGPRSGQLVDPQNKRGLRSCSAV